MKYLHLFFLLAATSPLAQAQTEPADPGLDWLMSQSKPATTRDASTPDGASPLVNSNTKADGRPAMLELSDGAKVDGTVASTPGRPLRVWDEVKKEYLDLPFSRVKSIETEIVWERDEREWQFKQAGGDEKVYSGRTYPARELAYTLTLNDGRTIHGGVVAPIEFTDRTSGDSRLFVLHKRDKGEPGQKLADLVYVKKIEFRQTN